MKKLLLATALVTLSGAAFAQDVVRLGTEGPTLPTTLSTTPAKSPVSNANSATSCASAPD